MIELAYVWSAVGVLLWVGDRVSKKVSVLCRSVWKYFDLPEATEVRRERSAIDPEKRFHQLIWDTILSDTDNQKGGLSRKYIFLYYII